MANNDFDIDKYLRRAEENFFSTDWLVGDNIHPIQPYTISVANSTFSPLTTILFNDQSHNMKKMKRKLLLVRARRTSIKPKPRKTK